MSTESALKALAKAYPSLFALAVQGLVVELSVLTAIVADQGERLAALEAARG